MNSTGTFSSVIMNGECLSHNGGFGSPPSSDVANYLCFWATKHGTGFSLQWKETPKMLTKINSNYGRPVPLVQQTLWYNIIIAQLT